MYVYEELKPALFTEEGQLLFLEVRDRVQGLLKKSGAVSMGAAIKGSTGNIWTIMACVDRIVELKAIKEITRGTSCPSQYRIFVKKGE